MIVDEQIASQVSALKASISTLNYKLKTLAKAVNYLQLRVWRQQRSELKKQMKKLIKIDRDNQKKLKQLKKQLHDPF